MSSRFDPLRFFRWFSVLAGAITLCGPGAFAQENLGQSSVGAEASPLAVSAPIAAASDVDARFQATYTWMRKPAFRALYSGENSLISEREPRSYAFTATAFLGLRPWSGAELFINPETSMSHPFSQLRGLGGLPNGENAKGGGGEPVFYLARLFLRQNFNLGADSLPIEAAPNFLGGTISRRRAVLTVGKISLGDIFDTNAYAHDPRSQFLNWTLMANGAFDYAADSRGYTSGAALEWYHDDWVFRVGRFAQPKISNGLPIDYNLTKHFGDQVELEHGHEWMGEPGKVRLLGFRNQANMGGFRDAVAAWRRQGRVGVPDVAEVRQESQKVGWGLNAEQSLGRDLGGFLRYSANDGKTEAFAFTEVERSLSGGLSLKGSRWGRSYDVLGLGLVRNGIGQAHREYLANGGLGAFIGDGPPPPGRSWRYASERIVEVFYSLNLWNNNAVTFDWQRAWNPAYNADRGPVSFIGVRLHTEY